MTNEAGSLVLFCAYRVRLVTSDWIGNKLAAYTASTSPRHFCSGSKGWRYREIYGGTCHPCFPSQSMRDWEVVPGRCGGCLKL
jgi:hypothetical protein